MNRRTRNASVNIGSGVVATLAHVALLAYLALNLKPFDVPPPEPPINVEIVELPPLYVPPPPARGRLDAAELSAPPTPAPPAQTQAPPVQSPPAPARTPAPNPIPRPEVLAASVVELAPQIKPEMQAPKPIDAEFAATLNPSLDPDRLPEVVSGATAVTAAQPSATAAQRAAIPTLNASQNPDLSSALREVSGAPGQPARAAGAAGQPGGRPGGIDERWRVRPDSGVYPCPPIAPERMTAEQRARCVKAPIRPPLNTDRTYDLKNAEFEAAARRKALLRDYRGSARGAYPGLNCTFRGKCPK